MAAIDRTLLDRIDVLAAENALLRKGLPAGNKIEAPYERLLKKYDDLCKRYRDLEEKHAKCRPYVDRATEKYRAAKEVVKQWQQFYDHQQNKANKLHEASAHVNRASSPAPDVADPERTPRPLVTRGNLATGEDEVEGVASEGADLETELPDHPDVDADPSRSKRSSETVEARARRVTSSQTTQEGSDPPVPYNAHPSSDDMPEFVSARPVKRRRGNSPRATKPTTQIKLEMTSPSQPQELNSEDFSSPVLTRRGPLRRDTSNLDAIVGNVTSPRKRRDRRAASAEVMRPPRLPTMTSSLSEGGGSDLAYPVKEEPRASTDVTDQATTTHDFALPPEGSDASDRALQPLSTNVARLTPRSDANNMKRKRKDEDPRAKAAKAAIVSEDGDMDSSQVHAQEKKNVLSAAVSRRLDSLLDDATPGRNPIVRPAVPQSHQRRQQGQLSAPGPLSTKKSKRSPPKKQPIAAPPVYKMPTVTPKRSSAASTSKGRPSHVERSPPPPDPEDEPLRSRPVIRLSIEDFKINSKYKGTDFAFADTLRGRDQRRCLPGCTKPECCGDAFRKMVEMGFKSKKTDEDCLEAYLGPAYEHHMASRPPAERKDLLQKARAYAIASEHGKHRQAFKRRASPPGFWRIDMPSTQEEEQDRIKAQEMVRQEVYDRWREAMNPAGRWKFRDE